LTRPSSVIAHYAEEEFDSQFYSLVGIISEFCDEVVIVTTSPVTVNAPNLPRNVQILRRPNLGYDFLSYRVGIERLYDLGKLNGPLLLVNSSFIVTDNCLFRNAVESALRSSTNEKENEAVGLTISKQFRRHIQSYFIHLPEKVLALDSVRKFWMGVQPKSSKYEVIFSYELGLSKVLADSKVRLRSVFRPSFLIRLQVHYRGIADSISSFLLNPSKSTFWSVITYWRTLNYLVFTPREVAKSIGIIKREVLEADPKNALGARAQAIQGRTTQLDKNVLLHQGLGFTPRVAVVVHVFHGELFAEISRRLRVIPEPFDLYVTTPFESTATPVLQSLPPLASSVRMIISENRGRDIAPFVSLLRSKALRDYQSVLKLHTKKSDYSKKGDAWRSDLLASLLSDAAQVTSIMETLESLEAGVVGPDQFYLTDESKFLGGNKNRMAELRSVFFGNSNIEHPLGFFAGSMFWFSPRTFRALTDSSASLEFEPEEGQMDGTTAHAFERIVCDFARHEGLSVTSAYDPSKEMSIEGSKGNGIPVQDD
jgi:lipopolysaccharide biosynthesis protein